MCRTVMKGLRFPNTQESCFEAWKRSYVGCSILLCVRFDDSQESRLQASKRSNMGSADMQGGRSADIHEFCFQGVNIQIWTVSICKRVSLLIVRMAFSASKRSDKSSTFLKRHDLLMLRYSVFTLRKVEI